MNEETLVLVLKVAMLLLLLTLLIVGKNLTEPKAKRRAGKLLHKLMIEGDEENYLRIANHILLPVSDDGREK